jgi:hypothetical protein
VVVLDPFSVFSIALGFCVWVGDFLFLAAYSFSLLALL